jgi:Family of unknown function (DUF6502)
VSDTNQPSDAAREAMAAILEPLAGLLLSSDIRYAQAEELLKMAFVRASARAFAAQGKIPSVSTVSVATGIRRREVKRVLEQPWSGATHRISPATQARLRWTTDPRFLDQQGQPRPLPRTGTGSSGEPGFADLAASVSKDTHAKALLDELLRIGVVEAKDDIVTLKDRFQPRSRTHEQLLEVGSANVADHLSALLMNLLSDQPPLLERAIFADELTQLSAKQGADLARGFWADSLAGLREKLQGLVDADTKAPDNNWRMRIGIYSYLAPMERTPAPVNARAKKSPQRLQRKASPAVKRSASSKKDRES